MSLCGLVTIGYLAAFAGIFAFLAGVLVLAVGADAICYEAAENNLYTVDNLDVEGSVNSCRILVNVYAGVAFFSGILWLLVCLLVFMFSCGDRYKYCQINHQHQSAGTSSEAILVNSKAETHETNPLPVQWKTKPKPKTTHMKQEIQVDNTTLL
jgi:uncharacterized membrane protein